jgi:hypothetical protein
MTTDSKNFPEYTLVSLDDYKEGNVALWFSIDGQYVKHTFNLLLVGEPKADAEISTVEAPILGETVNGKQALTALGELVIDAAKKYMLEYIQKDCNLLQIQWSYFDSLALTSVMQTYGKPNILDAPTKVEKVVSEYEQRDLDSKRKLMLDLAYVCKGQYGEQYVGPLGMLQLVQHWTGYPSTYTDALRVILPEFLQLPFVKQMDRHTYSRMIEEMILGTRLTQMAKLDHPTTALEAIGSVLRMTRKKDLIEGATEWPEKDPELVEYFKKQSYLLRLDKDQVIGGIACRKGDTVLYKPDGNTSS